MNDKLRKKYPCLVIQVPITRLNFEEEPKVYSEADRLLKEVDDHLAGIFTLSLGINSYPEKIKEVIKETYKNQIVRAIESCFKKETSTMDTQDLCWEVRGGGNYILFDCPIKILYNELFTEKLKDEK